MSVLASSRFSNPAAGRSPHVVQQTIGFEPKNVFDRLWNRSCRRDATQQRTHVAAASTSLLQGRFVVPATEVAQLQGEQPLEEFLMSLIADAALQARPPISGYKVGAVALAASGAVYVGVNIEFPGAPLNNSIHAEQCLLVNCLHHGEHHLKALAVSAAPCGHCRQFFAELNEADSLEFLFGANARPKFLSDLLPERFGPADLQGDTPSPLLLEPQHHPLAWTPAAHAALAAAPPLLAQAAAAALQDAVQCYAPYTRCYSGAAIVTVSGAVYSGGCVESAAYNPSLSPFHAAVVDAVTSGMPSYGEMAHVVLVQKEGVPVDHSSNIRLLLQCVAPSAHLTLLTVTDVTE